MQPTETSTPSLRILFFVATLDDRARLHLDREVRAIKARIRESEYRDCIQLIDRWAVQPSDLQQALLQHQPHIVHFSGYGGPSGILLQGMDGSSRHVSYGAIARMLKTLKDNIRVVVFNTCFSHPQAHAMAEHIDFTIGMNVEMRTDMEILFSAAFYMALGHGRSVLTAYQVGITELALYGVADQTHPLLLSRKGADASATFGLRLCRHLTCQE